METECRKFTRFLVPENVYAALGPSFSKVGRIKDISIGGLVQMSYFTMKIDLFFGHYRA